MDKKKNWSISDIESITEEKAKVIAIETMKIKEHNIYFVDFEDAFGYSCLVYKNNHIYIMQMIIRCITAGKIR